MHQRFPSPGNGGRGGPDPEANRDRPLPAAQRTNLLFHGIVLFGRGPLEYGRTDCRLDLWFLVLVLLVWNVVSPRYDPTSLPHPPRAVRHSPSAGSLVLGAPA